MFVLRFFDVRYDGCVKIFVVDGDVLSILLLQLTLVAHSHKTQVTSQIILSMYFRIFVGGRM